MCNTAAESIALCWARDRRLAPIAAVIPVRMRIDSEHAVDASNDSTSRSANNPTNKATDRSEHAVTGIGTAVCPVVHPMRHALRLCTDRRGEKEADSNHTEHSHLVSLLLLVSFVLCHAKPHIAASRDRLTSIALVTRHNADSGDLPSRGSPIRFAPDF